jgi:hypothetical protein
MIATTTLAQPDTASNCLLSSIHNLWVIDTRSTEHMTGLSHILSNYHPIGSLQSVTLAKGSLVKLKAQETHILGMILNYYMFSMFLVFLFIYYPHILTN